MVGDSPHGIARYALALWEGLPADPAIQYTALIAVGSSLPTHRPGDALLPCRSRFLSLFEQVELPWLLRGAQIDLLHATSISVPAAWRGPLVMTIHDVNHLAMPGWMGPGRKPYYERVVKPTALRASRVLTCSEFSGREIQRWLGVPAEKVRVAPYAIEPAFQPPLAEAVAALRRRLDLPEGCVLYVGNGRPHKNLELLWEIARLAPQLPLVLAGRGIEARDLPVPRVPDIADADLPALYGGAALFLFPSRYEGFGLPPLEAAACGAPVLVARGSSMDEHWEGTGSLLPPDQPTVWIQEIERLRGNDAERRVLAKRDAERASHYRSWEPAVTAAFEAYQDALRLT
jgi:glycosyltransferase involved in cell wall biosynthesis